MRPTQKLYNEAILRADNWRLNFDKKSALANVLLEKLIQARHSFPFIFIAGMLTGVLGVLLASQAFTV